MRGRPASSGPEVNAGWRTVAAFAIRKSLVPVPSAINATRVHSGQARDHDGDAWKTHVGCICGHPDPREFHGCIMATRSAAISAADHEVTFFHDCLRACPQAVRSRIDTANRAWSARCEMTRRRQSMRAIPIGVRTTRRAHHAAMRIRSRTLEPGHRLIGLRSWIAWECTTPCGSACQACERAITLLFDPERSLRNARTNSSSCEADIAASMGCTRWVANDARNDPLTSRMLNASASSGHLATQLLLRSEKSGKLTGKIVTGAHATVCPRRAYSGHALANQQAIAAGMTGIQGD